MDTIQPIVRDHSIKRINFNFIRFINRLRRDPCKIERYYPETMTLHKDSGSKPTLNKYNEGIITFCLLFKVCIAGIFRLTVEF